MRLTQKDLAQRWGCCVRTVTRKIRASKLKPVDLTGNQPVFDLRDVVKLERQRAASWEKKQKLFVRTGRLSAARRGTR